MANSDDVTTRLREEDLRAMIDGCEGVTPGPWWAEPEYGELDAGCSIIAVGSDIGEYNPLPGNPTRGQVAFATELLPEKAASAEANAAHIARLDPQTVSAMASELLSLRRQLAERDAADTNLVSALIDIEAQSGPHYAANRAHQALADFRAARYALGDPQ